MQAQQIKSLKKGIGLSLRNLLTDTKGAVAVYSAIAMLLLMGILALSITMNVNYSDQEKGQQLVRAALTQPAREFPYLWLRRMAEYHKGTNTANLYDTSGYLFCSKCAANPADREMTDDEAIQATITHVKNYLKSNGAGIIDKVDDASIKPEFKKAPDGTILLYVTAQVQMSKHFLTDKSDKYINVETGKVVLPATGSNDMTLSNIIAVLDVSRQSDDGAFKGISTVARQTVSYLSKLGISLGNSIKSAAIPFSELVQCPLKGCGTNDIQTVKANGGVGPAPAFGSCNGELMSWDGGIANNVSKVALGSFQGGQVNGVQHRILPFVGKIGAQASRICPSGRAVWTYKSEWSKEACFNKIDPNPFLCKWTEKKLECVGGQGSCKNCQKPGCYCTGTCEWVEHDEEGCKYTEPSTATNNKCNPTDGAKCDDCNGADWASFGYCRTKEQYTHITWYPSCQWGRDFINQMQPAWPGLQPLVPTSADNGQIYSDPRNHLRFRAVYLGCDAANQEQVKDPISGLFVELAGVVVPSTNNFLKSEISELPALQHDNSVRYWPYEVPTGMATNFSMNDPTNPSDRPYDSNRFSHSGLGLFGYFPYAGGGGDGTAGGTFFYPNGVLTPFGGASYINLPPVQSSGEYSVVFMPKNCTVLQPGGSLDNCDIPQGYYRIEVQGINLQGYLEPTDDQPGKNKYATDGTTVIPGWAGFAASGCNNGANSTTYTMNNSSGYPNPYDYYPNGGSGIECRDTQNDNQCTSNIRNKAGYTSNRNDTPTVVTLKNGMKALPPSQVLVSSFSIEKGRPGECNSLTNFYVDHFDDKLRTTTYNYPFSTALPSYAKTRSSVIPPVEHFDATHSPTTSVYYDNENTVGNGVLNLGIETVTKTKPTGAGAAPAVGDWHIMGFFSAVGQSSFYFGNPAAPKNVSGAGDSNMMNLPLGNDNSGLTRFTNYLEALNPNYCGEPLASGYAMQLAHHLGSSASTPTTRSLYLLSLSCPVLGCGAGAVGGTDSYPDPGTGKNLLIRWSSESNGDAGSIPYTKHPNNATRLKIATSCPTNGTQYVPMTPKIWKEETDSMKSNGDFVFPIVLSTDDSCASTVRNLSTDQDPNKYVGQQVGDLKCGTHCADNAAADLAYQLMDSAGKLGIEKCEGSSSSGGGDQCRKLQSVKPVAKSDGSIDWQNTASQN